MPERRTREEWIARYSQSHTNRVNRACHVVGIPAIVLSLALLAASLIVESLRTVAVPLFVSGWVLQFIGHAFEGKPPEFFKDWRFLLVGLRWWLAKMRGRA